MSDQPSQAHPAQDDLYAYAIGALDPVEERVIAKHVPYCQSCSAVLRERINPAVSVLAESVEQHTAPAELRERVMAVVRDEAVTAPVPAPRRRAERGWLTRFALRPAMALAAAAIVAAGIGGYLAAGDDERDQGTSTVAVASPMAGAGGSLVVEKDAATLHVHGMPGLRKAAVYQVWVAEGPSVRPSAAFVPHEDGTATAAVPEVLDGASEVMVTQEPRAGRQNPTLPSVLSAQLN